MREKQCHILIHIGKMREKQCHILIHIGKMRREMFVLFSLLRRNLSFVIDDLVFRLNFTNFPCLPFDRLKCVESFVVGSVGYPSKTTSVPGPYFE